MKLTALSLQDGVARAATMPYAYIRTLSDVYMGNTPEVISLEQVEEARFFGETAEIRFLWEDAQLMAMEISDEAEDITADLRSPLIHPAGAFLTKRRYVLADEDGQCNIVATRLLNLEGV